MIFGSLFKREDETRGLSYQEAFSRGLVVDTARTHSGTVVTPDTASRMVTVHACTSLLADSFAQLPAKAIEYTASGERVEVAPPKYLSEEGTGDLTRHELVESLMLSLVLSGGNFYAETITDPRTLEPVELRPLDPARVTTTRGETGAIVHVVDLKSGDKIVADDYVRGMSTGIVHVPGLRAPGALMGVNPIERARQAIGLGLVTEEHGSRLFADGSLQGGVIELPGPAEQAVMDRLKAGWESAHRGTSRAHRPGVLSDGASWKPTSIAPDQAQFLETRGFQVEQICQLYRVPPHMVSYLSKSTSWGTGIEEQSIGYVTFTLGGWINRAEARFSRLVPDGQKIRWNVSGLLRGAAEKRFAAYASARQWGWLSVNDIRRLEDLNPIDGGDEYLEPLNMTPAGGSQDE